MTNAHFQQLIVDFSKLNASQPFGEMNDFMLNGWLENREVGTGSSLSVGLFVPHALLMPAWTLVYELAEAAQPDLMKLPVEESSVQLLGDTSSRLYAGGWGFNVTTRPSDEDMAGFGERRREMKKIIEIFAERERQIHLTVHADNRAAARTFSPVYHVGLFHLDVCAVYARGHRKPVVSTSLLRGASPKNAKLRVWISTDDARLIPRGYNRASRDLNVAGIHELSAALDRAFTSMFHVTDKT